MPPRHQDTKKHNIRHQGTKTQRNTNIFFKNFVNLCALESLWQEKKLCEPLCLSVFVARIAKFYIFLLSLSNYFTFLTIL